MVLPIYVAGNKVGTSIPSNFGRLKKGRNLPPRALPSALASPPSVHIASSLSACSAHAGSPLLPPPALDHALPLPSLRLQRAVPRIISSVRADGRRGSPSALSCGAP